MQIKLAERLREVREKKGVAQEKLADIMGFDKTFFNHVENDRSKISIETLVSLALFFDVTTDYLLGFREDE